MKVARLMHVSSSARKTQGSGKTQRTSASLDLSFSSFFLDMAGERLFWGAAVSFSFSQ